MATKPKQFFSDMEEVRRPLQVWRKSRKHRDRIPDVLWHAMAKLARVYGVSPVRGALGIDYYDLKDRAILASKQSASSSRGQPAFIEIKPALPISPTIACRVELEDRSGTKMILHLDGSSGVDALALAQAFWNRKP